MKIKNAIIGLGLGITILAGAYYLNAWRIKNQETLNHTVSDKYIAPSNSLENSVFVQEKSKPKLESISANETSNYEEQTVIQPTNQIERTPTNTQNSKTIKIANWNLQIFGDKKAANPELMRVYVTTLTNYDIAFVQEIRDTDGSSFMDLCSRLTNYESKISSRAGRSNSKEQYGVVYKKGIRAEMKDYNPDAEDRWERPPVAVTFNIEGYSLTAYNIHTKPSDVQNEMDNLERIVKDEGNIVILGDLNAEGNYYNNSGQDFNSWAWLIRDDQDTTIAKTDCAYDRIIVNSNLNNEVLSFGIFTNGITGTASDHYPVWFEINANE